MLLWENLSFICMADDTDNSFVHGLLFGGFFNLVLIQTNHNITIYHQQLG